MWCKGEWEIYLIFYEGEQTFSSGFISIWWGQIGFAFGWIGRKEGQNLKLGLWNWNLWSHIIIITITIIIVTTLWPLIWLVSVPSIHVVHTVSLSRERKRRKLCEGRERRTYVSSCRLFRFQINPAWQSVRSSLTYCIPTPPLNLSLPLLKEREALGSHGK